MYIQLILLSGIPQGRYGAVLLKPEKEFSSLEVFEEVFIENIDE